MDCRLDRVTITVDGRQLFYRESGSRDATTVVLLHGFGGNHRRALASMTPAQAVALEVGGRPLLEHALAVNPNRRSAGAATVCRIQIALLFR